MGLKGLMSEIGMNLYAVISLIVFFISFAVILVWVWTRPREEMEDRAKICLDDEDRRTDGGG